MKKTGKIIVAAVLIFLLIAAILYAVGVATDILELRETGYDIVYVKNLATKLCVQLVVTLCIFAVFVTNSLILCRNMVNVGSEIALLKKKSVIIMFCLFVSAVIGIISGASLYSEYMVYNSSVYVGTADPIFGKDIGYYLFQMPLLSSLWNGARAIMMFQIVFTILGYLTLYVQKDIDSFKNIIHEKSLFIHTIINVILFIVAFMGSCRFQMEELLWSEFASLQGAGYLDTTIWINYYKIIPFVTVVVLCLAVAFLIFKKLNMTIGSLAILPAVWLVFTVISAITGAVLVEPYEASVEEPYIEYNIAATRAAFGLDKLEKNYFAQTEPLNLDSAQENAEIFSGACISDEESELSAMNASQSMRNFYTFTDSDIAIFNVGGKKTPVRIAARELDTEKLPKTSKNYISEHLQYTHGYGVVMKEANGGGDYIIKNIPVTSYFGAEKISQPRIYFGERTNDYALVGTSYSEIDYIEGEKTVEYRYSGKAGIPMSFTNRLLFAIKTGDFSLASASYINSESRLLTNRNIIERAQKAAPFLTFDKDPYIVTSADGRLKWVIDAYTTSDRYPYSQEYNGINYIRNSVKAVVDAYDGTLVFFITDETDPLIRMYRSMYPGLFSDDALYSDIAEHTKYPAYLLSVQSEVYKKYHTSDAKTFYSGSDNWEIAKESFSGAETPKSAPSYNFSPENGGTLSISLGFTREKEDELVAFLSADKKGLRLYTLPKGEAVQGFLAVKSAIDTSPYVSEALSSWTMSESTVLRGDLHILPVQDSLLFAQSVYVTTDFSDICELKKVIAVYSGNVAIGDNLNEAVGALFGNISAEKPVLRTDGEQELIDKLINQFADVKAYSAEGNFESFGSALSQMEQTIDKLEVIRNERRQNEEQ